jgi:hypothetical protein
VGNSRHGGDAEAMAAGVDPVFAVATIRPISADAQGKGIRILSGGRRMQARNFSLRELVMFTYEIHPRQISGGPAWFETDRYDIEAEPDEDGTTVAHDDRKAAGGPLPAQISSRKEETPRCMPSQRPG